jgi:hypothetical protein
MGQLEHHVGCQAEQWVGQPFLGGAAKSRLVALEI